MENKNKSNYTVTFNKKDFLDIKESMETERKLMENGELINLSSFESNGIIFDEMQYTKNDSSYLKQRSVPVRRREIFDTKKNLETQTYTSETKLLNMKLTKKQKEKLVKGTFFAVITALSLNLAKNTHIDHVNEKEEINILVENLVATQGHYLVNDTLKGTEINKQNDGKSAYYLNVYDYHLMAEKIVSGVLNDDVKTIDDVYVSIYSIYQALDKDAFLNKKELLDNIFYSIVILNPGNTVLDSMYLSFDEFLISNDCFSTETAIINANYSKFMDNMLLEMANEFNNDLEKTR